MIQSVERAARILKALGSEGAPRLGVTELSERLGLPKATVYGLLRTLEAHQLVEQDLETGKYRLGPTLLQLGNAFLENHELRSRSLVWAEQHRGFETVTYMIDGIFQHPDSNGGAGSSPTATRSG